MNPRKTTVEPKGSKEFHPDKDVLTVEVVHAARILEEFFAKLGYDEWILMGVCSRKLLEKVQQRVPNPAYWTVGPSTAQQRMRAEAGLNIEAGTYNVQIDMQAIVERSARSLAEQFAQIPRPLHQWSLAQDPQPYTGIEVGLQPTPLSNRTFIPHTGQPGEFGGVEEMAAMGPEEHRRFEEHLALRRAVQQSQSTNEGRRGLPSISTDGTVYHQMPTGIAQWPATAEEFETPF